MGRLVVMGVLTALAMSAGRCATAAEQATVETLLTGLDRPGGVAVRPGKSAERYEIFVAESGAGGVLRIQNVEPKATAHAITGFALDTSAEDSSLTGPTSLLFLDERHLVVASGGDEAARLQLFELSDGPAATTADQATQQISLKTADESVLHAISIARTRANDKVRDELLLVGARRDRTAVLQRVPLQSDTFGEPRPFAQSAEKPTSLATCGAIAVDQGGFVVGSLADAQESGSQLVFFNPVDGSMLLELATNLEYIAALAYCPRTSNLYAAVAAPEDTQSGGVYRIDAPAPSGSSKCVTVKIAEVRLPIAIAFGPDGAMYVTADGDSTESTAHGQLLRISGDL